MNEAKQLQKAAKKDEKLAKQAAKQQLAVAQIMARQTQVVMKPIKQKPQVIKVKSSKKSQQAQAFIPIQTVTSIMPAVEPVNGARITSLPSVGNQPGYGTGTVPPGVLNPYPTDLFDTGYPSNTSMISSLGPASGLPDVGNVSDYPDLASAQAAALAAEQPKSNGLLLLIGAAVGFYFLTR